jgi:hypothetical protein
MGKIARFAGPGISGTNLDISERWGEPRCGNNVRGGDLRRRDDTGRRRREM